MHTFEDIRRDLHVATLRYQSELLAAADLNEKTRRQALKEANETGIKAVVDQQFEIGRRIVAAGLVPIIEPEVDIHCPEKAAAEENRIVQLNGDLAAIEEKKVDRERKLAELEGGQEAVLFSSGMAAIVGVLMARLNAGDEVIFFDECYHRSREFCAKHLSRFGVVTRQVKACDYDAMEAAITPSTRMLVSESPTNGSAGSLASAICRICQSIPPLA